MNQAAQPNASAVLILQCSAKSTALVQATLLLAKFSPVLCCPPLQKGSRCRDLAGQLPSGEETRDIESGQTVGVTHCIYPYSPVLELRWAHSAQRTDSTDPEPASPKLCITKTKTSTLVFPSLKFVCTLRPCLH